MSTKEVQNDITFISEIPFLLSYGLFGSKYNPYSRNSLHGKIENIYTTMACNRLIMGSIDGAHQQ